MRGEPRGVLERRAGERRFRLGSRAPAPDLAELVEVDQAHFARDFRTIVGKPPAGYARGAGRAGG